VSTQFILTIKAGQCDNECEFNNNSSHSFFLYRGVQLACVVRTLLHKMARLSG
jgi:hypothetical protein